MGRPIRINCHTCMGGPLVYGPAHTRMGAVEKSVACAVCRRKATLADGIGDDPLGPIGGHNANLVSWSSFRTAMVGDAFNLPKMTLASALNNQVRTPKVTGYLFTKPLKNRSNYHKFRISDISFCSETTIIVQTKV